ncbi:hypothetical protein N7534_009608 [Penicillium rubens]|nr:hypothetical protein N7534_009608 [Penicillium rubens]
MFHGYYDSIRLEGDDESSRDCVSIWVIKASLAAKRVDINSGEWATASLTAFLMRPIRLPTPYINRRSPGPQIL